MIARWPTCRCREQDIPGLRQTRSGIRAFVNQQDSNWSGTEPFSGGSRPDTFTFHNGNGRGAVWRDRERAILWLCCASDQHDGGYAHGHELADAGQLYPDLDPAYLSGIGATTRWGTHADEDALESLRVLAEAGVVFSALRPEDGGGSTTFDNGVVFIRLSVDDDEIWTMTIRQTLVYPDQAMARDRWLSVDELERIFTQLTGLVVEEAEWWAPPHDGLHVNVHFLGGPLPPAEWLDRRIEALLSEDDDQALRV